VDRAVRLLCTAAGTGDLAAAKALIPWINQALGMPSERVEHRTPSTLQELEEMDTEQLAMLVAEAVSDAVFGRFGRCPRRLG
jgi:hypothetical protein